METFVTWRRMLAIAIGLALVLAACSDDGDEDTATDDTAAETADDSGDAGDTDDSGEDSAAENGDAGSADLQLSSSDLGDILVDAQGNTIYLFAPDDQGESTCYDECEAAWPIVGELSSVGDGLDSSLLGTTDRTTGDVQATYNGWPLYYFANDSAPGDTNGQGVNDVWFVMDSAGNAVSG